MITKLPQELLMGDLPVQVASNTARLDAQDYIGLEWNQGTDKYFRLGKQVLDFEEEFPWSEMIDVNLADDGAINALKGDPTFTYDGSNGEVMRRVPKTYYRFEKEGDVLRWFISKYPLQGFSIHESFFVNGVLKDHWFGGKFEGHVQNGKLRSISGVQPTTNTTKAAFRSYAQAHGMGWNLQPYHARHLQQVLAIIKAGTFDSQASYGRGVVDKASGTGNESVSTGQTVDLIDGYIGSNGLSSVACMGFENLWGNIYEHVEGVNVQNYIPFLNNTNDNYVDDRFDGNYVSTGIAMSSTSGGYQSKLGDNANMLIPTSVSGGSSTTFITDALYTATGNRIAHAGGSWSSVSGAGLCCLDASYDSSFVRHNIGARLFFI